MLTLSHSGDDMAKALGALTISRTPRDQFSEKGVIISEVFDGAECDNCPDQCPGFAPHAWSKLHINKAAKQVVWCALCFITYTNVIYGPMEVRCIIVVRTVISVRKTSGRLTTMGLSNSTQSSSRSGYPGNYASDPYNHYRQSYNGGQSYRSHYQHQQQKQEQLRQCQQGNLFQHQQAQQRQQHQHSHHNQQVQQRQQVQQQQVHRQQTHQNPQVQQRQQLQQQQNQPKNQQRLKKQQQHKKQQQKDQQILTQRNRDSEECFVCGHEGHSGFRCFHRNMTCHICKEPGHLASVCKQKVHHAESIYKPKTKPAKNPTHRNNKT